MYSASQNSKPCPSFSSWAEKQQPSDSLDLLKDELQVPIDLIFFFPSKI